jgi:hypothetical protein
MRRPMLCALLAAGALTQGGCVRDFDPVSLINKLRLLTVTADFPERAAGETARLTAHYTNPGGPAPTLSWSLCLEPPSPASGGQINPACAGLDMGAPMLSLGTGPSVNVTMPAQLAAFDQNSAAAVFGLPDGTNGYYLPVRLQLTAGTQQLTAFYRLRWHASNSPNPENLSPVLTGIFEVPSADAGADAQLRIDDDAPGTGIPPVKPTPPEVHLHDEFHMRAVPTMESQQPYLQYDSYPFMGQPRQVNEIVAVNWYTTAGTFDHEVTGLEKPDTKLTLDKHLPASGTPIDIWAVALDGRGGSTLQHATLTFR